MEDAEEVTLAFVGETEEEAISQRHWYMNNQQEATVIVAVVAMVVPARIMVFSLEEQAIDSYVMFHRQD